MCFFCGAALSDGASDVLMLPSSLKVIDAEAFAGDVTIVCVVAPNGATTIASKAFSGCVALEAIEIPDSVTSIAEDAFDGCENVTFYCGDASEAARYAQAHGIPHREGSAVRTDFRVTSVRIDTARPVVGDTVAWTAKAADGVAPYKVLFELYKDGVKHATRTYAASDTYAYTFFEPGVYFVLVKVKDDDGEIAERQSESVLVDYQPLAVADVRCDKDAPRTDEETVWTASAVGGQPPYQYAFELKKGETSLKAQDYASADAFRHTFGEAGSYTLTVRAKDGRGVESDAFMQAVAVDLRALEVESLIAGAQSAQTEDEIVWTVRAVGGAAPYSYVYELFVDGVSQGAAASSKLDSFSCIPAVAGSYSLKAVVTDARGVSAQGTSGAVSVTLLALRLDAVTPADTWVKLGGEVSWTAFAAGGQKPLRYAFDLYKDGEEIDGRAYSAESGYVSIPESAGFYTVSVRARDALNSTVTLSGGAVHVYDTVSVSSVRAQNAAVTAGNIARWTVVSNGGKGAISYAFEVYRGEEKVYASQPQTETAIEYVPMLPGSYTVRVTATDEGGETASCASDAVTASEGAPTPAENFTVVQTSGRFGKITSYTGSDTVIVIPGTVDGYTIETIGEEVFRDHPTLVSVALPSSVLTIEYAAFRNCTELRAVTLNEGLEHIGDSAFYGCAKLTSLHIPDSVTDIDNCAFKNCEKLASVNYPVGWKTVNGYGWAGIFKGTALTTIAIPEGVTQIPAKAFSDCDNFTVFDLPSTLTGIADEAFAGCTGLSGMTIPEKVESIGNNAFRGCAGLIDVTLNGKLKTIEYSAFEDCSKMQRLRFAEGLETIENYAFKNCDDLTRVDLPLSLQSLGEQAFAHCDKLARIYVGLGVTSIGWDAFADCPLIKIYCEWGSEALAHAKANSLPYYYLSLTGAATPSGTLYKGDTFTLRGYVRSSDRPIEVTATIYNADESEVLQTVTVSADVNDYNLIGTVDANMRFSALALGTYRYRLTATAGEETEVLANTRFTVVPPPLRVSLLSYALPSGMVDGAFSVAGTIRANYALTQVRLTATNATSGSVALSASASPGTLSYDLKGLADALDFAPLPAGTYVFRVIIVANGTTRTVGKSEFAIGGTPIELTDEYTEEIITWAQNASNGNIFDGYTHYMQVLDTVDRLDAFHYSFVSCSKVLKGLLLETFCREGSNTVLIDAYKAEIAALIDALDDDLYLVTEGASSAKVLSAFKSGSTIIVHDILDSESEIVTENMTTFYEEINRLNKKMGKVIDVGDWVLWSCDTLSNLCQNYENGLLILSIYENSNTTDREFRVALDELAEEYSSRWLKFMSELYDKAFGELLKEGTKAAAELLGSMASSMLSSYKKATFLIEVVSKFTGLQDHLDDFQDFFIQTDTFINSRSAYVANFSAVHNGDTSEVALNRLALSFRVAREAGMRLYDTMSDYVGWATQEGQELTELGGEINLLEFKTPFH